MIQPNPGSAEDQKSVKLRPVNTMKEQMKCWKQKTKPTPGWDFGFPTFTQSSRIKAKSDFVGSASLIKSILQALKNKGQGSRSSDTEVIA